MQRSVGLTYSHGAGCAIIAACMIDLSIAELIDDSLYTLWLERHLHPYGLTRPHGGPSAQRPLRAQGHLLPYCCRAYDGYGTLLIGTVFAKTRQRLAALVLCCAGWPRVTHSEPRARIGPGPQTASYPAASPPSQPV